MPGVTLHFVLADRALERWRAEPEAVAFDARDPDTLNAYYHGAVGPDLGYFPGGEAVLSDLAHCVRPGVLTRALLRAATNDRQRAFAWGWATHVLADQIIHPLIGRGVGELLTGRRDRFIDGSSNLFAHLRVEMGVDAWYARENPDARGRRLRPAFEGRETAFLVQAYAATYGSAVPGEQFLRSHQATTRRAGQALASLGIVQALMGDGGGPVLPGLRWALRTAYRSRPLRSVALAYLNPVRPAAWLIDAIEAAVPEHGARFLDAVRSRGRSVEDLNLDTGRPCAQETEHAGTRRALEGLSAMGGARERPTVVAGVGQPEAPSLDGLLGGRRPAEA